MSKSPIFIFQLKSAMSRVQITRTCWRFFNYPDPAYFFLQKMSYLLIFTEPIWCGSLFTRLHKNHVKLSTFEFTPGRGTGDTKACKPYSWYCIASYAENFACRHIHFFFIQILTHPGWNSETINMMQCWLV